MNSRRDDFRAQKGTVPPTSNCGAFVATPYDQEFLGLGRTPSLPM